MMSFNFTKYNLSHLLDLYFQYFFIVDIRGSLRKQHNFTNTIERLYHGLTVKAKHLELDSLSTCLKGHEQ